MSFTLGTNKAFNGGEMSEPRTMPRGTFQRQSINPNPTRQLEASAKSSIVGQAEREGNQEAKAVAEDGA